jgi:DNA-directed RNA polymerase specialized sigma24 family protein
MTEQSRTPQINFDEWSSTPAEARRVLLDLRRLAAEGDKSLAKLISNKRKIKERTPGFRKALTKTLESLLNTAKDTQSRLLNTHSPSLSGAARQVLLEITKLGDQAGALLTIVNANAAGEQKCYFKARRFIRLFRATANAVPPLCTLLDALNDVDLQGAWEQYEETRDYLIDCLTRWGSPTPDVHADEAMDRVIRKIEEGEEVRDLKKYCRGLAHNIWYEYLRRYGGEPPPDLPAPAPAPDDVIAELKKRKKECARACFSELPPNERELLIEYYKFKGRKNIEHREELADREGISLPGLRARIHNIRKKLLKCQAECLKKAVPALNKPIP